MIFKKVMTATDTATTILEENEKAIAALYDVIYGLLALIDFFNNFLTKFGALLKRAGATIDTAAEAVKAAPAPGPWKILTRIVGQLLDGIGAIIKTVGKAIEGLGKLARANKSAIEKLEEILAKALKALQDLNAINQYLLQKIAILNALAKKLEEQQDDIEAAVPIRKMAEPIVDDINKALKLVRKYQKAILDPIKPLMDEIARIQAAIDSLNPLEKLLVEFDNAVRPLREAVQKAVDKVKEGLKALYLDKALDAMDKLINWMLEKLGIKKALNKVAETIKELPFIKKIQALQKQAEAVLKDIGKKLEDALKLALEKIKELELVKKNALELFLKFLPLAASKLNVEMIIPEKLRKLLKGIKELRKALKQPGPDATPEERKEYWRKLWELIRKQFGDLYKHVSLSQVSQFGVSVYVGVHKELKLANDYTEELAAIFMENEEVSEELVERADTALAVLENHVSKATQITSAFAETVEMQPDDYYNDLARFLVETEGALQERDQLWVTMYLENASNEAELG